MDRAICRSICLRGFELSSALCTTSTRGCRSAAQSKSWFFRTACLQSFSRPFSTKPPSKARRREFICSLQKTTPVTSKPVLFNFRGNRVEEEVLSSQSKLLGIGYSLLQSALDAWAVAAGHDSKFWEASDVFLMIANCQAIKREQSLHKDARYPESNFRILRKLADGKALAFRVVPTAARQFTNPTINQYYNGNSIKLHRAVVQSQSSHSPQQQPAKRPKHGVPEEPWSWLPPAGIMAGTASGKPGGKTDSTPGERVGGKVAESPTSGPRPDACDVRSKARRVSRLSSWLPRS